MTFDESAIIRRWLTCDCGKLHAAAGASESSLCACGRRLGKRLWSDAAEQSQPEPAARTSEALAAPFFPHGKITRAF